MNELLVCDTTFGERSKAPINFSTSRDWVYPLLTFQVKEVKQEYLKDNVKKVFLLKMTRK